MRRGEIWFAATPGGDRPVLVLTRDPVASRIGAVVVAALTRTERGLVSELKLSRERDGVPSECVVSFDNVHTVPRESLRRRVTRLGAPRMAEACRALRVEAMQLTRKADQEATMSEISQAIDGMFPSIPGGQPELFSTKEEPTDTALPEAQADRREAVRLTGLA